MWKTTALFWSVMCWLYGFSAPRQDIRISRFRQKSSLALITHLPSRGMDLDGTLTELTKKHLTPATWINLYTVHAAYFYTVCAQHAHVVCTTSAMTMLMKKIECRMHTVLFFIYSLPTYHLSICLALQIWGTLLLSSSEVQTCPSTVEQARVLWKNIGSN